MNTLLSVEFLRLRSIMDTMVQKQLISQDEANALIAKTGYVIVSHTEYIAPDGSVLNIVDR